MANLPTYYHKDVLIMDMYRDSSSTPANIVAACMECGKQWQWDPSSTYECPRCRSMDLEDASMAELPLGCGSCMIHLPRLSMECPECGSDDLKPAAGIDVDKELMLVANVGDTVTFVAEDCNDMDKLMTGTVLDVAADGYTLNVAYDDGCGVMADCWLSMDIICSVIEAAAAAE